MRLLLINSNGWCRFNVCQLSYALNYYCGYLTWKISCKYFRLERRRCHNKNHIIYWKWNKKKKTSRSKIDSRVWTVSARTSWHQFMRNERFVVENMPLKHFCRGSCQKCVRVQYTVDACDSPHFSLSHLQKWKVIFGTSNGTHTHHAAILFAAFFLLVARIGCLSLHFITTLSTGKLARLYHFTTFLCDCKIVCKHWTFISTGKFVAFHNIRIKLILFD